MARERTCPKCGRAVEIEGSRYAEHRISRRPNAPKCPMSGVPAA